MNIILIGPPGSGKGTQAVKISEKYKIAHISTGDLLREISKSGSELGNRLKRIMTEGKLIPDDVVINLIEQRITDKGFVLDGFPRTLNQAKMLGKIAAIDAVLFFDLPDKEAVRRLSKRRQCRSCNRVYNEGASKCVCGSQLYQRDDDKEEAIRERLKVYQSETKPLLQHYKSRMKRIDASQSVEKVFKDVCGILSSLRV